jgi:hypothetical protein
VGHHQPDEADHPLTATATPTMSDVTTKRFRRRRCTSTPSEAHLTVEQRQLRCG